MCDFQSPILFLGFGTRDSTTFYFIVTFFFNVHAISNSSYEIRIKHILILLIVYKTSFLRELQYNFLRDTFGKMLRDTFFKNSLRIQYVARNVATGKKLSIITMFFLNHKKKTITSIARISSVFIFKFFITWDKFSRYLMYRSIVNKSWRALFYCS